ncbi:hypothetical protein RO3G_16746 [Lichtheimia corymbifera JMRC:FSU:9682]|uniref:Reverse transcriptase domain-containing protein n=1 Tax=Lichtheimia corymbifera JMRC:FSU:9682 TaxID=1263082 RepID=A0A068SID8_9FUNG|nr:hypothetical protein RO3G_16746 [Lichtheimia corymbifera JMRC:FSU:9682]
MELRTDLSSPYAELYHLMHIRYMQQRKLKLSLRQFALAINQYAQRHHIPDDKSLLMDFVCNVADQFRKPIWDIVMKFHEDHDRLPSMGEMVKLAGTVEDANKMSRASDQSKPWAEVENDDDDHSDSDSDEESDEDAPAKKRKRSQKSKGKQKANAKNKGKRKGKGKGKANNLFCQLHGQGDHDTDHCFHVLNMVKAKHGKQQQGNKPLKPCDFCKAPYKWGHHCPGMDEYNAKRDAEGGKKHQKVMARYAMLKYLGTEHYKIDDKELMGSSSKQCKNDIWVRAIQKEKTDQCLLIPIMIQNLEVMALLDKGCTHSLVNKNFVVTNKFEITPTDGSIHLAADGLTVPRMGSIKDMNPEIPVYLGMDILSKMGIGFTGLTSAWPNMVAPSSMDSTVIDPEPYEPNNSPAGTDVQRDAFFKKIDPLILDNKRIPKTSFCTLDESIITLDTGKHKPVYKRQYPIPIALEPVLQETIDQWLADGTIEPATVNSSWNSPLTFAPKKDAYGNYTGKRPCLDPRHINRLIADDRHPLPLIRDIFHGLNGASVFTTLDLKSAFHRFKIRPEDRHKTAFTVKSQQYMFRGCPFGLKPISSKFQRVMDKVFKPMSDFVLCFVDDIVIFSATMEEHIEHVARAIKALTEVNLILNADKCHFAQKAVYLLGFCVSEAGCTLDPRKLTNIQSWPIPKTGKDIQRFMGVVNYFREHVPKISTLTAPLDELRNVNKLDDKWTDKHTDAFIAIQKILTNTPILRYPNMAYPFSVATDASNVGIGAVLYQVIDGETRHISFMARALSKSERNY